MVGRYGEDLAVRYLDAAGLDVLDRNWRCPEGELDIVALDGAVLAFVEVKTRSTLGYGDPAEAVHPLKAPRIHRLALRWLDAHRECGLPRHPPLRFDVVSVLRLAPGGPAVRHLRGAF